MIVALCLGLAGLYARPGRCDEAAQTDQAREVLRRVAERYRSADTYQGDFTVTQRVRLRAETQTANVAKVSVGLKRPNKLRAQAEFGGTAWAFVCDGSTYWTYLEATQKYLEQDAPPDFDGWLGVSPLSRMIDKDVMRVTLGLFRADPYAVLTEGAEQVELVGAEQVGGEQAQHVRLRTAGSTVDVWASATDSRIVQASVNPWKQVQEAKRQRPALEDVTIEVTYAPAAPDAPEPSFVFEPPAGARRAKDVRNLLTVEFVGGPFIDFTLPGLKRGTTWHLAEHKGKVIALDFWASWCGPCRQELPKLQGIYDDCRDKGFLLLAVNTNDSPEEAAAFLEKLKLSVPVAVDTDGRVAEAYNVNGFPTLVLIGRDGTIQAVHIGYGPGVETVVRSEVEKLLAGESLLKGRE